ncbi:MAG: hypothetical protein ACO2PN_11700 [Pyrobaculum sp.]
MQCFLVVSRDCHHCRELLHKAKDAVELLTKRGLMIVNIEDFPEAEHLAVYSIEAGDLRLAVPTPQVVCMVNRGGAWFKVYSTIVKSAEEFHDTRRFLEAKLHWLKLQYGKMCFETRGRKSKKGAEDAASVEKRRSRKKKEVIEEEA